MRFHYQLEHITKPHHIITVKTDWRNLPVILDGFRNIHLNIRRAHITESASTFYMKDLSNKINDENMKAELTKIINMENTMSLGFKYARMRLPLDTQILMYNVPTNNYTTMEFGCNDRIGLLCDLLQFLEPLSVDLKESYVTTVGNFAHNIIHLSKGDKPLSDEDMMYIYNVFEYEAKERFTPTEDLM